MQTEFVDLHYQLHFRSPFHFGTGLRAGLVQRSLARNQQGLPFVPGSTLKGVLRQQATHLARLLEPTLAVREPHVRADEPLAATAPRGRAESPVGEFAPRADLVALIFGSRYHPGTLYFDDAILCKEDADLLTNDDQSRPLLSPTEVRTRVSMARRTGTARRGLLFSSEYGLADLHFAGRIYGLLTGVPFTDDDQAQHPRTYSLALLLAAFQSLDHLGGSQSSGCGKVVAQLTSLHVDANVRTIEEYLAHLGQFEYYTLMEEES